MNYDYQIKPVCIMLSKKSTHAKRYNGETKWMYFLIHNDE